MVKHRALEPISRHPASSRIYADQAERLADTDFNTFDEGLFAWQQDEDSLWLLTSSDPVTWKVIVAAEASFEDVSRITFDTSIASSPHTPGLVEWNSTAGTLDLHTDISPSVIQIGHETLMRARNNSGGTILNGQVVRYSGVIGGMPTIVLADASEPYGRLTLGMATHDIPNNTVGLVTMVGAVRDIDTSSFSEGDIVYLSSTEPGGYQTMQPPAPLSSVAIGVILVDHPTTGMIGVRIRIFQDLVNLADVGVRGATLNDYHFLKYDFASSSWKEKEIPWLVGDDDPTGFHRGNDSAGDEEVDGILSFDDGTRTVTLTPSGVSGSFWFYVRGRRFIKTAPESIVISDVEGGHIVYYDETGTLQTSETVTSEMIIRDALVAYVYWDATNSVSINFVDERHGYHMDGRTHLHLHSSLGSVYHAGLEPTGLVADGDGDLDESIQFGYESGQVADEDIFASISAGLVPSNIPIYYRVSTGLWREKSPDDYPLIYGGTAGYAGTLVPYNEFNGSTWSLQSVGGERSYHYALFCYY